MSAPTPHEQLQYHLRYDGNKIVDKKGVIVAREYDKN